MTKSILTQPETKDALILTLNSMGYMLSTPEKYIQAFIDFSAHATGPVLDIGAAYGLATLPALEKGAYVIANDLDERHLQILQNKVPPELLDHLEIRPGKMPDDIEFEANSLGAVLASRVLNFLLPEELGVALEKIFKWLKPGGKFFILAGSPYVGTFRNFFPLYEERKAAGHEWAGLIQNIPLYSPECASDFPQFINLLDKDNMGYSLKKAGFTIEEMDYSPATKEHPEHMKQDGREQLGVIAYKI